jgi:hypothetical protein
MALAAAGDPDAGVPVQSRSTSVARASASTSSAITSSGEPDISTAWSIPRLRSIGFMPADRYLSPSWIMAWARTVAVVVPSPAISLVRAATSRSNWAPMFSKRSSSSIDRATTTPELTICGVP